MLYKLRHFILMLFFNSKLIPQSINFILFSLVFIIVLTGFLNIPSLQNDFAIEAFLLILVSILLIIQFVKGKIISTYKLSEIVFTLFVISLILKNLLSKNFDQNSLTFFSFIIILYHGLKIFFTEKNISKNQIILKRSTAITLFIYLLFALYHCYIEKEAISSLFIPNKSIFSILLASQIAFIVPIFYKKGEKYFLVNWFFIIVIIGAVLLLSLTNGRAGWLGLILAVVYIVYQYLSNSQIKKIILYLLFPFLILVFALLLLYKSGSSSGRMLIYKVSAGMLKDNLLWGIGQGQFKVNYNEYQAVYFSSHSIDSKEALLADNTFYAFNDFLQAVIENGVVAFLILVVFLFLLVVQIKNVIINVDNKHLFTAAVASLICILTGSLFSYPLQIFPVIFQATLCLAIINSFSSNQKQQIHVSKKLGKLLKTILLLLSFLLLIHFCFYFIYKTKSNQAFQLKRAGFKQKAIEKYTALNAFYINEGDVLYSYAQELYYSNQLQLAKKGIDKAKKYYPSNDVYKLSAAIQDELKNYASAEKDYKTAVYMIPNRMISRNELLSFYLERKDTTKAIYWANSIINMPIKIPSQTTSNIQKKAKEILIKLNK